MKIGLNEKQAKEYACSTGLILLGFTVSPEHSIVLCERGKEDFYSKKQAGQQRTKQGEA